MAIALTWLLTGYLKVQVYSHIFIRFLLKILSQKFILILISQKSVIQLFYQSQKELSKIIMAQLKLIFKNQTQLTKYLITYTYSQVISQKFSANQITGDDIDQFFGIKAQRIITDLKLYSDPLLGFHVLYIWNHSKYKYKKIRTSTFQIKNSQLQNKFSSLEITFLYLVELPN
ncbi:unnamed protein product [Paramecium sonneborni]|uniref:Uncharacterized protein n=1 Tax=Paramecium sonneborni TaxID=65129 RepID=A0A8S1RWP1_9CILI|nr:unnamed protein product [Paramecium sonneborni]